MSTAIVDVNSLPAGMECTCCSVQKEPLEGGILVASSSMKDHIRLGDIFQTISCERHWATSAAQAIELLQSAPIGVIVCEEQLRDGDWRSVLAAAQARPDPPLFIVISWSADAELYAEVVHSHGFDVIAKPFYEKEVLDAVSRACRLRRGIEKLPVGRRAQS